MEDRIYELSEGTVSAFRTILRDPSKYGFKFNPIQECFERSEKPTAKHILYQQYIKLIKNSGLPKIFFYIIMDELYASIEGKDEAGNLGYYLKIKDIISNYDDRNRADS